MMTRYTLPQRLIHWLIALLMIGALAGGQLLDIYGFKGMVDAFGQDMTNLVYKYHKTFGVIILGAMVIRLILRGLYGAPPAPAGLSPFQHRASQVVHILFYVLLFAMPVLGWLATAAGGFPVEFFNWKLPGMLGKDPALSETLFGLHGLVGKILMVLFLLHAGAALQHWLIKRDGVMRRMGFF